MSTPVQTASAFRAGMRRLRAAVAAIPEDRRDQIAVGQWTPREILAHIAAWDRALVWGLDELLAGRRPAVFDEDERAFNVRAVHAWRGKSWHAVEAELEAAHASLMSRLDSLSSDQWRGGLAERWVDGTSLTVGSLFGYRYRGQTHYDGHAEEMEAAFDKDSGLR